MIKILAIFTCIISTLNLLAQQSESIWTPAYNHYTVNDGLAQSQVMSVMQDSRGYIWAGMKAGISKYNGAKFENYYMEETAIEGEVSYIEEDSAKNIWFFTGCCAGRFNGSSWKAFKMMRLESVKKIKNTIFGFSRIDSFIYKVSQDTIVRIASLSEVNVDKSMLYTGEQIEDNYTFGILFNGISTYYLYDIHKNTISYLSENIDSSSISFNIDSFPISWISNKNVTVYGTKPIKKKIKINSDFRRNLPSNVVSYIETKNGYVLANAFDIYLGNDHGIEKLVTLPTSIDMLYVGGDETIWVGAEDGLYQIPPSKFQFISPEKLPAPWSIVEQSPNKFFIGSYGKGLYTIKDDVLNHFVLPREVAKNTKSLGHFYFGGSYSPQGDIYLPHTDWALIKRNKDEWINLKKVKGFPDIPQSPVIVSHYDPIRHQTIFGANSHIFSYHNLTETVSEIKLDSFKRGFIVSIAQDQDQNYWFGSGSVWKYNPDTKKQKYYSMKNGTISFGVVYDIAVDSSNGVWFATDNYGLNYYYRDSFYRVAPDLIHKSLYNVLVIDSLLTVGGIQGLFIMNLNEFYRTGSVNFKCYNSGNGFLGIEPNQSGSMVDSRGNYWVLCTNGIFRTHKTNLTTTTHPAKVRIYQINNELVSYGTSQTIHLSRNENSLTIRFESIGFERTTIPEYSWRLLSSHTEDIVDWSPWSQDQIAYYASLPSDDYIFEVRSKHPGRTEIEYQIADIYSFTINNDFYKEPYFYKNTLYGSIAVTGLIILMLGRLYHNRVSALKSKRAVEDRERKMRYYQVQSARAQLNDHFIANLLDSIKSKINLGEKEEASENIQRLAKVMRQFLDSSVSSDLKTSASSHQDILLSKEIELLHYYIQLEQSLRPGVFDYSIETAPQIDPSVRYIIPMMIQPFVENAIKHGIAPLNRSHEGFIHILFDGDEDLLRCTINDNGTGYDILQSQDTRNDGHRSHGGRLVRERAELLRNFGFQVKIETYSKKGEGTQAVLEFRNLDGEYA